MSASPPRFSSRRRYEFFALSDLSGAKGPSATPDAAPLSWWKFIASDYMRAARCLVYECNAM
jgi:hypothetical protein